MKSPKLQASKESTMYSLMSTNCASLNQKKIKIGTMTTPLKRYPRLHQTSETDAYTLYTLRWWYILDVIG